jgi:tetrahydromethanopterin S-methyltransferase subunit C
VAYGLAAQVSSLPIASLGCGSVACLDTQSNTRTAQNGCP